jgi:hypothetical protein
MVGETVGKKSNLFSWLRGAPLMGPDGVFYVIMFRVFLSISGFRDQFFGFRFVVPCALPLK